MDELGGFFQIRNSKSVNKRMILDIIRFSPGGVSRAELARRMLLTRSAMTSIIADYTGMGLVDEIEIGSTTGGRRPVLLAIKPGYGKVVGVDMGATHLSMIVTDFSAHVLAEVERPLDITDGPERCLGQVDGVLNELLGSLGVPIDQVSAVCLGVPGPVEVDSGEVSSPPIMPGWDRYPLRQHLEKLWHVPVTVGNDAELGALGEWAYGAARGVNNLAYIKVGTGVGAGLMMDGRIYRGSTGCAGEIGHITVQENGPLCSCGNRGCLEAMAGGQAIARKARQAVASGKRTELASIAADKLLAGTVALAAGRGDLVAQQIITEAGQYLGLAIASLVNLFNPDMVVIGGGVAQLGDQLLDPIRNIVKERSLKSAFKAVHIRSAMLGRRASSMGAVVQAVNLSLDQLIGVKLHMKGGLI